MRYWLVFILLCTHFTSEAKNFYINLGGLWSQEFRINSRSLQNSTEKELGTSTYTDSNDNYNDSIGFGYLLNDRFSIELSDTHGVEYESCDIFCNNGETDVDLHITDLKFRMTTTIARKFNFIAHVGYSSIGQDMKHTFDNNDVIKAHRRDDAALYGLGFEWRMGSIFAMRLEAERSTFHDLTKRSLNFLWYF